MIKAVITDFDGTLVDTFLANCCAYSEAFARCGLSLTIGEYQKNFGLRFNEFMDAMNIEDETTRNKIKELKKDAYPKYFHLLKLNKNLMNMLTQLKKSDVKIAIASTARKENLIAALDFWGLTDMFDLILTGESVKNGKPDPEIYILTMEQLGVTPEETLIFEDSEVGLKAAEDSGAKYIKVTKNWFE